MLQDAASAGQRVLTRSAARGACPGAPGMPELFPAHGAVGWGDSTGMCTIQLALFSAASAAKWGLA